MKNALVLVLAAIACGCAHTWQSHEMQADHSYKIEVAGNGFAGVSHVKRDAEKRAIQLCPRGYETKSEIPDDTYKPTYTLTVVCK